MKRPFYTDSAPRTPRISGFTLVEVLVSAGIIAIFAVFSLGVVQKSLEKGKMMREMNAGKTLISSYLAYASDNDGNYLPGMDATVKSVWFEPQRRNITMIHVPARYPYRLAPYFDYKMEGVIQINQPRDKTAGEYLTSVFPAFGINYYLVGGNCYQSSGGGKDWQFPGECVTRMSQTKPILAFATGGTGEGENYVSGFNILTPPNTSDRNWSWSEWKEGEDPGMHGNVDARFEGKAIAVFLDGSIQLKTIAELDDMRLWSRNAAEQNDRAYKLSFY